MPRQPRFFVPGETQHVIQRGNNRAPIFAGEQDYCFFLDCLRKACIANGVLVHAYVLMTNHVHLLATPMHERSFPRTLQSVGRRYVQFFNATYRRTGTLWEGRYRASVVDSEPYLLTCMRYIEMNPVRAGMVAHPSDYRWSSHRANAKGVPDSLLTPHELYCRLGRSLREREQAYCDLFRLQLRTSDLQNIRETTNKNWALGDAGFVRRIAEVSGRQSTPKRQGRQSKTDEPGNRV
jgi:putative transposase